MLSDIGESHDASAQSSEPGDRAGEGGSAFGEERDGAASDAGAPGAEPGDGGAGSSDGSSVDAAAGQDTDAGADAGRGGRLDAAAPGELDAAASGEQDAAEPPDGAAPVPDSSVCAAPVTWYQDGDRDGYGRSSASMQACSPGRGGWVREAGDCNDDDERVHPNQADYFDVPYQAPDGSASFDYDCSGGEEGNGQQATLASEACGLLSLALCSGSGYLPVRAGAPNPWCGSHQEATCVGGALGLLLCQADIDELIEPYWCR